MSVLMGATKGTVLSKSINTFDKRNKKSMQIVKKLMRSKNYSKEVQFELNWLLEQLNNAQYYVEKLKNN